MATKPYKTFLKKTLARFEISSWFDFVTGSFQPITTSVGGFRSYILDLVEDSPLIPM